MGEIWYDRRGWSVGKNREMRSIGGWPGARRWAGSRCPWRECPRPSSPPPSPSPPPPPPPKQQDWEEGVGERKKWSSTSTYRSGSSEEEVDVMRVLLSHRSVLYTPPTVHAASSFSPFIYHGVFFFLCVVILFLTLVSIVNLITNSYNRYLLYY